MGNEGDPSVREMLAALAQDPEGSLMQRHSFAPLAVYQQSARPLAVLAMHVLVQAVLSIELLQSQDE